MIPKIKLDDDLTPEEFIKNNNYDFWCYVIDALKHLTLYPNEESATAFILYGKKLLTERAYQVDRNRAEETIDKALKFMLEYEEYEKCQELENYRKILNK